VAFLGASSLSIPIADAMRVQVAAEYLGEERAARFICAPGR
jgi:hypothetical protein